MTKPFCAGPPGAPAPDFASGSPSVSGSPSPRLLRAQYAGTPPPPNVPVRSSGTPIGTPRGLGLANLPPDAHTSSGPPSRRVSSGNLAGRRPGTPGSGGDPTNAFDDITDEEKARILRKHLVGREERQQQQESSPRGSVSAGSDREGGQLSQRPSSSQLRVQREDSEPFPVPYHAPGADMT